MEILFHNHFLKIAGKLAEKNKHLMTEKSVEEAGEFIEAYGYYKKVSMFPALFTRIETQKSLEAVLEELADMIVMLGQYDYYDKLDDCECHGLIKVVGLEKVVDDLYEKYENYIMSVAISKIERTFLRNEVRFYDK